MQKDATTGAGQTDRSIGERLWDRRAELLWGLAAAVLLLTFVDPVLLVSLVLAGATIAAAWLGIRELVQSATRDDAKQVASPAAPRAGWPTRADVSAPAVARPPRRLDLAG